MLVISLAEDVYMDGEERQDNFPNLGKDNVTKRQSDNVDIPNDISKSIFNEISTSTSNNILIDFSNNISDDNSYSNSNSDVFSTTPSSMISASSDSNSYSSSTPRMSNDFFNGISSESPSPRIHYTTNKKTSSPKKRKSGPMISSERNTNSWRSDSIYSENSPTSSSGFFSNSSLSSSPEVSISRAFSNPCPLTYRYSSNSSSSSLFQQLDQNGRGKLSAKAIKIVSKSNCKNQ